MTVGTERTQPSPIPVSLFLKLPAIMFAISPTASHICGSLSLMSPPTILEAITAAEWALQRNVKSPHSCPAIPTIAVKSPAACATPSPVSNLQPNIISNTSRVASSNRGLQVSGTLPDVLTSFAVFIFHFPAEEPHVL